MGAEWRPRPVAQLVESVGDVSDDESQIDPPLGEDSARAAAAQVLEVAGGGVDGVCKSGLSSG